MIEAINETRLDNGLTILTDQMPTVRSATLGFFFKTGARHEPEGLHGISHFIEHTVFKGTRRRTALEIAREQDQLGGNLDAFTTHEETGFAIKVIDKQLPAAFDLLSDILTGPLFDERELRSEQRVIIEEMKMIDDSPEEFLGELFNAAYFADNPLGRSITGTAKTVRRFDRHVTADFHSKTYTPANLVITAAGNVEHKQVVRMARSIYRAPTVRGPRRRSVRPKPRAPILIKRDAHLEQAHLVIAVPFVTARDKRRYAAEMLSNIIGGGTSSRLWQKVREERGLAYNVGSSTVMYQDCGLFTVFAGTSPGQIPEVVKIVVEELRSVVKHGVTADELELAKDQAVASILLSLEDSASRATALAQSEMVHGRQISVEETISGIMGVTVADLKRLAKQHFISDRLALAALGDLKGITVRRQDLRVS
jgi:predicted Zn-dependent peptidase